MLEPEEEGYRRLGLPPPDVKADDFRNMKVRLVLGPKHEQLVEFVTPWALCYPQGTRARGCQELLVQQQQPRTGGGQQEEALPAVLPCVMGAGGCPFVRFTCSKGHTWQARPGTPACFYCPRCKLATEGVSGVTAGQYHYQEAAGGGGGDGGWGSSSSGGGMRRRRRRRLAMPSARTLARRRRLAVRQLQRLRAVASERGGVLLTGRYAGVRSRVAVQCSAGHEWEVLCTNLLAGSWCPHCKAQRSADRQRLTLADMQALAHARGGGRCLSERYEGSQVKLLWECARGHRFERAPNNVRKPERPFCSQCAKDDKKKKNKNTPQAQLPAPDGEEQQAGPLLGRRGRGRPRRGGPSSSLSGGS